MWKFMAMCAAGAASAVQYNSVPHGLTQRRPTRNEAPTRYQTLTRYGPPPPYQVPGRYDTPSRYVIGEVYHGLGSSSAHRVSASSTDFRYGPEPYSGQRGQNKPPYFEPSYHNLQTAPRAPHAKLHHNQKPDCKDDPIKREIEGTWIAKLAGSSKSTPVRFVINLSSYEPCTKSGVVTIVPDAGDQNNAVGTFRKKSDNVFSFVATTHRYDYTNTSYNVINVVKYSFDLVILPMGHPKRQKSRLVGTNEKPAKVEIFDLNGDVISDNHFDLDYEKITQEKNR